MDTKVVDFDIGQHHLALEVSPSAFNPTLTSKLLYEQVVIPADGVVLDLGCGVGPLAIAAALDGAKTVYAVDIMAEACELARANAKRNGVAEKVKVLQGNLFEPLAGLRFDVIIDDVSGMAETAARLSPWFPSKVPTGGADGAGPTVQMLQQAKKYLTPGGCLYLPVLSLANAAKITAEARRNFIDRLDLLLEKRIPFCPEFNLNILELERLKKKGIIDFLTKRGRNLWTLQIFKATTA